MTALRFITESPIAQVNPNRSDVACFVGFVSRLESSVPEGIVRYLKAHNLSLNPSLLNVPIPIDSWAIFQQLFSTERLIKGHLEETAISYLAAAVRSFFAQGGRRCLIIRMGDPLSIESDRTQRLVQLNRLLPGFDQSTLTGTDPNERSAWQGVGHLFGTDEVSFLCLPDLCDLIAADPEQASTQPTTPNRSPERFSACSAPQAAPQNSQRLQTLTAPRCDDQGYQNWAKAVNLVGTLIAKSTATLRLRPIQLVAAIPLPVETNTAQRQLRSYLESSPAALTANLSDRTNGGLISRSIQLTYPWIRSANQIGLPEGLESPDGVLTGLLARNALTQGTYRSAASLLPAEAIDAVPILNREQLYQPGYRERSLLERVSIFGPTPNGTQLLSDVTTSLDETLRPASVHRLIGVVIRAARQLGQAHLFEANGSHLWSQLTEALRTLMGQLFDIGALRGATPEAAFEVRCDRTTMTQNDIDNGRLIARINFAPALPVERITVTLTLSDPDHSLLPVVITPQEAA